MANDNIGGSRDSVQIRIGDSDVRNITQSYEIKTSILQQPAAFTLRLGWSDTAVDLLNLAKPGTPFELYVAGRKLQTGTIDCRAVPSAKSTEVEVRGRDYLGKLFDAYVEDEQSFTQKTYFELTRKVLDLAGLTEDKGHFLQVFNDANRRLLTGSKLAVRSDAAVATELSTGALGGTGNLVFETPKTKVGERYYDFLTRLYRLAGLFLWASPDRTFVLSAPNANQPPTYVLYRARGSSGADEISNVLDCSFRDDITMRNTLVQVFGRSGGCKRGVQTCVGEFVDDEIFNTYGIKDKQCVIRDGDVKSREQCEFVARRIVSEQRRMGWQLEYTVMGHTVFSANADNQTATWGPDTVVQVEDEELGMSGPFYIEACTYCRSSAGTTTKLTLMRPGDLLFATGLAGEDGAVLKRKLKVPGGRTVR